jgi:5-methylcytosine-specific restriction endonuclease McrA
MQTAGFKFDKPVRKKKKNHSIRNKRRTKRGMVIDLDKSARHEILIDRDRYTCQRCGIVQGEWVTELERHAVIQWAHVHTREYYITRWEPDNSLTLCDRCHVWFDNHKVLSYEWFSKTWPERWAAINRVLQNRLLTDGNCQMKDADIRALWESRKL